MARQAAVIPVRRLEAGLEVCLIRRKTKSKWGVPKGYIESGDWEQAALAEALEEAGLYGRLLGDAIGTYEYRKDSMTLRVVVGVMEVLEERATWQEMQWRARRWCSMEEAADLLRHHPVRPLYEQVRPTLVAMLRPGVRPA